ncbi:AcaB family transcriptional regulator [Neisseria arctica]|uniref:AcaB family transcriptional regulator n=1 Tax=Neisseria arctica TaxID=1470200 RepID=UPI000649E1CA|nr:AcaB family transcriptional regulator [Neisseria arctica]UOO87671.1 TIGR03761 family integrating conjugative element protein [Neisseria arctica]
MEILKQQFVIKPHTIAVTQDFEIKVASKSSPFSDGYDMAFAAAKLGDKVNGTVPEDDPDYRDWETFKAHELLLKKHLKKVTGRSHKLVWGEYEILSKIDERFDGMANLRNKSTDSFMLHTKQGMRMWDGNDNHRDGAKWPGIRYGLKLSNDLIKLAKQDNPIAQYELLRFEKELVETEKFFETEAANIEQKLEQERQNGINVSIMVSQNPKVIPLYSMRGYGYRLIRLLTSYDHFVCGIKTISIKGIISNTQAREKLYGGGRQLRRLLQMLYDAVSLLNAIAEFKRESVLDETNRQKLANAVSEGLINPLPLSVWRYETMPAFVYIRDKLDDSRLEQIIDFATQCGMVLSEDE